MNNRNIDYTAITDEQLYALAVSVTSALKERGWRISFAESCTGGLAAATLVSVPDASLVFDSSIVTYSNESKVRYLGVSEQSIMEMGVVSEQVAGEMAVGAARAAGSDAAVSVTGIAGPGGATDTKPVGMVCFGFYINGDVYTQTLQFGDVGRNAVREVSVRYVYSALCSILEEKA